MAEMMKPENWKAVCARAAEIPKVGWRCSKKAKIRPTTLRRAYPYPRTARRIKTREHWVVPKQMDGDKTPERRDSDLGDLSVQKRPCGAGLRVTCIQEDVDMPIMAAMISKTQAIM